MSELNQHSEVPLREATSDINNLIPSCEIEKDEIKTEK